MLEKIIQIKNVGRFRNCGANGDVTFRKLTLIYAENGRGKTTLYAVLRSLQNGQPELIAERKTLASTEPAVVHIRLNGTDHKFTNNAWNLPYPDIIIFDQVFVSDNLYSGNYVEHEHFKNIEGINELNYWTYYSDEDIYRGKVLESYGYKFLRINRFNVGQNLIHTLDKRIASLIKPVSGNHEILKA